MRGGGSEAPGTCETEPEPVDELRRWACGESFYEQPMVDLNSEAIDFQVASELFAPVRKLMLTDLDTLRRPD